MNNKEKYWLVKTAYAGFLGPEDGHEEKQYAGKTMNPFDNELQRWLRKNRVKKERAKAVDGPTFLHPDDPSGPAFKPKSMGGGGRKVEKQGAVAGAGEGAMIGSIGQPGDDEVAGAGLGAAIGLGGMPLEVYNAQQLREADEILAQANKQRNDPFFKNWKTPDYDHDAIWGGEVDKWTKKRNELEASLPEYMLDPPAKTSVTPKYQGGLDDQGFEMYRSTPEG